MKKIYLLLLLATFSLNLFCQQDDTIVLDSTYSYKWDSQFNEWLVDSRWIYEYDVNGRKTEEISHNWEPETNEWVGIYRWVRAYDANGNGTEIIEYNWDSETNDSGYLIGVRFICLIQMGMRLS